MSKRNTTGFIVKKPPQNIIGRLQREASGFVSGKRVFCIEEGGKLRRKVVSVVKVNPRTLRD